VDAPLRQGPMIPDDLGQTARSDSEKLSDMVGLLREIRELLKPKPLGRPKMKP